MKNLIKFKIKQNIWLTGCLSLIFVLCRPMMQLLTYENTRRFTITPDDLISVMEGFFLPDVFTDYIPTLVACMVIGLVYFSYLFSKKKVDLYHSIPVNRTHIFIANYVSGIIIYISALVIEYMICAAIAITNHYMTFNALKNMFLAIACNLLHFLYGYGIIICTVMLTGNIVVSIIGSAVIALFFPAVELMLQYMERYFFVTYTSCESLRPDLLKQYYWLSPIVSYGVVIQRCKYDWDPFFFKNVTSAYASMILPLIMTVIVTGIAYLLYMKRPSEAAGKAIAFKKSRCIIEIPVAMLAGLIGVWFMSISVNTYKNSWIWAGAILGVVLAHIVMEIIFNESFKAILSHKLQLLCTITLVVFIVGIYFGDFTKYDNYVPNREQIKTAGIYFEGIDNNLSHLEVSPDTKNEGYYTNKYLSGQQYAFENRVDNEILIDKIFGVSKIGTTCVQDMITSKQSEIIDSYYYREAVEDKIVYNDIEALDFGEITDDDAYNQALKWMEENGYYEVNQNDDIRKINIQICYELNSGRLVFRQYDIPLSKVIDAIGDIYNTEEYNMCHFDIYKGYEDGVISKVEVYDSYESRIVSLTEKEKDELMETYISELKKINIDTISQVPIGRLTPSYKVSELYDESYSGYYLYPEFKKTLALIESYGADTSGLTASVNASDIVNINVSSYNLFGRSEQDYAYIPDINYDNVNDADFINELAPMLFNANNVWSNETLIDYKTNSDRCGAEMMVYITPENGVQRSFSVRIKDGVLPEKIKKDLAIKLWSDNQF